MELNEDRKPVRPGKGPRSQPGQMSNQGGAGIPNIQAPPGAIGQALNQAQPMVPQPQVQEQPGMSWDTDPNAVGAGPMQNNVQTPALPGLPQAQGNGGQIDPHLLMQVILHVLGQSGQEQPRMYDQRQSPVNYQPQ